MHIQLIERYADFNALEREWNAIYEADPEAQFFLSWQWMSTWLDRSQEVATGESSWVVLVARPSPEASPAAILPLRFRPTGLPPAASRTLVMAGRRYADYTGLVCRPGTEPDAIPALGAFVRDLEWHRWELECLRLGPARMELLMREFPQEDFKTSTIGSKNADEDTDNSICPFIDLPDDWDAYLATRLSSNSRQKLRRLLRTLERSATLRITHASSATIERDIKILLHFWKRTWQERKGDRLASILRLNSAMLLRNFADGNVFIPVLWDDRRPLGVLAFFVDQRKKSLLFSIAGRDTDYQDISPGLLLHAYSIRLAISKGCRIYDFLRGNEPYKYSFGARDHRLHSFAIARR